MFSPFLSNQMWVRFVICKSLEPYQFLMSMKKIISAFVFIFISSFISAQSLKPFDDGSAVKFIIKNFGINTAGSFKGLSGTILYDTINPVASEFDVTVTAATIDTDITARDNHLRKEEYFVVEKFPDIHFKSTKVTLTNSTDHLYMFGILTIKGINKEIKFPFTVKSLNNGYLFQGVFTVNRRDFNLGGRSISLADEVKVDLSIFAR
jgi:polyisoprenoid-binding protein YceI